MDNTAETIRMHRLAFGIPGGRGRRVEKPAMGIRNQDAARLTGFKPNSLSSACRRGAFGKLPDGTYDVDEFERWVQSRGVSDFTVPDGLRGILYKEDALGAIPEQSRDTPAALELLQWKVQNLRLKVEWQEHQLAAEKAKLVRRDVVERTLKAAVGITHETAMAVGGELAPSLTGLDDEYEIKRRIDAEMRALLKRMQARVAGMIEPSI